MEHLHNISSNIDNNYDMFMFCDDDDTYHIKRVETLLMRLNMVKIIILKISVVLENISKVIMTQA
jgi:hypothetical protein